MNLVFIENAPGSGQTIIVSEAFDDCVVSHRLAPGDNARIAISRFKSIVIDDETVATEGLADPRGHLEKAKSGSDRLSRPKGQRRRWRGGRTSAYRQFRSIGSEIPADKQGRGFRRAEKPPLPE